MLSGLFSISGCAAVPAGQDSPSVGRARELLEGANRNGSTRPGDLWVRCSPEDAEVWVDEAPRARCSGLAERGLKLGGGMHRVEVKKDGYQPYLTYYEPGGARANLTIHLEPLGSTP